MDEAGDRSNRLRAALTRRRVALAGTVLVFAGLLVALREVDLRAVAAEVSGADPALLAAAVCVYAVSWPLRGRRYGDVLAAIGHPTGTGFLTLVVFLSQTGNLALPARAGDGVRAYAMNARRDVPYPAGAASLAVERGFDLAAIATLAGAATCWLALAGDAGPLALAGEAGGARTALAAAGGVTATTLTLGAATVVVARSDRPLGAGLRARCSRFPRLRGPVEAALRFARTVAVVARNPRAMVVVGAGSLLVWALDVLTAVLVLAALDSGLAAGPLLAVGALAVSVGNLAKVLPLSQGGVGLYEAAFTALVVGLTPVGASTALAAAVVDHALKNAVTLVGGAGAVAALGISPSAADREAETGTGRFLGSPKR
ncbi:lysylphosphatidylglycerol synthase transmembrane domain-containing protein [Salinilacihabitans rarus]|uniref:lysylphosphatidylglycerol synthase transmembrane domain-containing protein n=1 Tax=Salinilacihabitans rarus TaxID=2961596 RepID=UPI0020C8B93B|nr:lysylphosphatidylglycerol synthase transmembrane domain-containing protein [Salinilacihabitans rarus]